MPDPELLELLVCPACRVPVSPVADGGALECGACRRRYPVEGGRPAMLLDRASDPPMGGDGDDGDSAP